MNCTICGKPIELVPTAAQRAGKSVGGWTTKDYENHFTEHSECLIKKRKQETSELIQRINNRTNDET